MSSYIENMSNFLPLCWCCICGSTRTDLKLFCPCTSPEISPSILKRPLSSSSAACDHGYGATGSPSADSRAWKSVTCTLESRRSWKGDYLSTHQEAVQTQGGQVRPYTWGHTHHQDVVGALTYRRSVSPLVSSLRPSVGPAMMADLLSLDCARVSGPHYRARLAQASLPCTASPTDPDLCLLLILCLNFLLERYPCQSGLRGVTH